MADGRLEVTLAGLPLQHCPLCGRTMCGIDEQAN
jgi:hypothetical protein